MGFMVISKATGLAVSEFFDDCWRPKINRELFDTEETGAYLSRVNAEIRNGSTKYNSKET